MANLFVCRFCAREVAKNHYTYLFSPGSLKKDLPVRMASLHLVEVANDDGLPPYICRDCLRQAEAVECKLTSLRSQARESYKCLGTSKKRPKNTSGLDVSPFTVQSCPPAKQFLSRKKLFDRNIPSKSSTVAIEPLAPHCSSHLTMDNSTSSGTTASATSLPAKSVKISVSTPSRSSPYQVELDSNLSRIERSLAGSHLPSIATAVFAHTQLRELIVTKVFDLVTSECSTLCRRSPDDPSVFRTIAVEKFSWGDCVQELKSKAPFLFQLLLTIASHNDHRNTHKQGDHHYPGICMAAATLLKERNREMCGVQSILSLVLFNSQVQKKVYTRLNHLNVCISYNALLKVIDSICKRNKIPIAEWLASGAPFKFVGDNLDKRKVVRDIRSDHRAKLHHMFTLLAIKGRVQPPPKSSTFTPPPLDSVPHSTFLPSAQDIAVVKANLVVLFSRILCTHMKHLKFLSKCVVQHIPHAHSREMSEKSDIAVIDLLHKNENIHSDMVDIMRVQQSLLGEDFNDTVLSGGDYLTCERQRCAQQHLMDGDTKRDRLELLEPVTEDWHMLMIQLLSAWKVLFSSSSRDHGTLGHLCGLLGRLPNAKNPKKDLHASCDALFTILKGHVLTVACSELDIDHPDTEIPSAPSKTGCSVNECRGFIKTLAEKVVNKCSIIDKALLKRDVDDTEDKVYNYSRVLCHLASLALELTDAWSEGDGIRVLRCWHIHLLHFFATRRTKYALEALPIQFQLAILPPHLVHQLTWGRFVNTRGGAGNNYPNDLHNEFIVKRCKGPIHTMGSNFTQAAATRIAQSVTTLTNIADHFDDQSEVPKESSSHTTKSNDEDIKRVVKVLQTEKVWEIIPGRRYHSFRKMSANPLKSLDWKKVDAWIDSKVKECMKYRRLIKEDDMDDESIDDDDSDKSDEL